MFSLFMMTFSKSWNSYLNFPFCPIILVYITKIIRETLIAIFNGTNKVNSKDSNSIQRDFILSPLPEGTIVLVE